MGGGLSEPQGPSPLPGPRENQAPGPDPLQAVPSSFRSQLLSMDPTVMTKPAGEVGLLSVLSTAHCVGFLGLLSQSTHTEGLKAAETRPLTALQPGSLSSQCRRVAVPSSGQGSLASWAGSHYHSSLYPTIMWPCLCLCLCPNFPLLRAQPISDLGQDNLILTQLHLQRPLKACVSVYGMNEQAAQRGPCKQIVNEKSERPSDL